jgi:hypothetical protein
MLSFDISLKKYFCQWQYDRQSRNEQNGGEKKGCQK